ncbi:pyrroline-5-carboxylate reductase [bacterium BMS3Abin01]|nr:pyrroline-5-carboxylate reductase [bacterium BMS3Abin01]HDY69996.1 pyrroline-5-carboxylate reductase [Actinomycetota bacterium]
MTIDKIGLIGCGNMGSAFVKGWLKHDSAMASRIIVADVYPEAAEKLSKETGVRVAGGNAELAEGSDLVLLAVKPNDVEAAIAGIASFFGRGKILASVAAGRTIAFIEALFSEDVPVFRMMPNVAVEVCAGTICFAVGSKVDPETEEQVYELFSHLGRVVPLTEKLFAPATAIAGSGPGFMAVIVDAFVDAGVMAGLPGGVARELTYSMLAGTAALLVEAGLSPSELRHIVTSPAGTTAAGISQLERDGIRSAIIDSVQVTVDRAIELG